MKLRSFIGGALASAALAACATSSGPLAPAPFDPANCTTRELDIYFVGQSSELTREARRIMDGLGQSVQGCRIEAWRVVGATDAQGGAVSNDQISERRAQVIAEYLATRVGWPRSRMTVAAAGERGAVTEEGLAVPMRRRARIVVDAVAP